MTTDEKISDEKTEKLSDERMRKFLRRHWKMTLLMVVGIVGASIGAVFVFLWVVADAQLTGLVPASLGQWTIGYCFAFVFNVLLWELVYVGSWAIPVAVITVFLWYKKLPAEERKEYEGEPKKKWPRRGSTAGGEGFFEFLIGVVWLIIMWVDGRWDYAFQAWTFNDWIYSWLTAALWVLVPLGIGGGTAFVIWWLSKEMKKETKKES
jgi:hypothetical protein